MSRPSSFDLEYPRKKHIIYNLSQLLNQKPSINPQISIDWRMLPQQNQLINRHIKTANLCTRNQDLKNMNSLFKKKQLKINFQHYRTKSTMKSRRSVDENKFYQDKKNIKFTKKINSNLLPFHISNSPSVQGVSLEKSYKSQQLFSQKSLKKNQNIYAFRQQLFATQKNNMYDFRQNIFTQSLQLKKKLSQPNFNLQKNFIEDKKQIKLKQQQRKIFLKKGSSLQKQIVVNLLRNKMLKEYQYQTKKQYSSKDILNMVKLYKGISFPKNKDNEQNKIQVNYKKNRQQKKGVQKNIVCPIKVLQKFHKPIQGWQIQPQFQLQVQKTQENKQKD